MIKVTYDNGFGYTACLYEDKTEALEDAKVKAEELCWNIYRIEEVE